MSRSTVAEAYARLVAEGYVEGRRGGGSVVAAVATTPPQTARDATALVPAARTRGLRPYEPEPAPGVAWDLRPGVVDDDLFRASAWRRCLARAAAETTGHYTDPAGTPELRAALAHWVTRSRGVVAVPDQVVVTAGAGHATDLVARTLLDPPAVVAVEEPGYPPVVELLRHHGHHVVGVPVDDQGIVVDAIPRDVRLVYVTPSHQYPLGMVMSRPRRAELLAWASRARAAIVEDDYDSEFRHTARPLEPLQRLDRDGRVIYVGTFSKSLSPGLRLGFAVVPRGLASAVASVRQTVDWSPPLASQAALTAFVTEGHLDRHLRRCRTVYRERQHLVRTQLERLLPPGCAVLPAHAGLHLAVTTPHHDAVQRLRSSSPSLRAGSLARTYLFSDPVPGLLVGFGGVPTAAVPTAVGALTAALA
ncbi:GntR family transcriptional regulator/MocR family aminotransferase [Isoptericola variabilis J7]|uniref:MocR-like pyridoxine biosynthesis transcription factor PdxR n=1 Tax=Isoptericola variabilis TaxID=139208 RepID=UPI0011AC3098|nr:PLP-dependent aminotransferase family protein [Isoptericola variabilis]TWH28321.1 GntR family transcriptional regulator/MocR family aminotransferase [Isoptericola variabilis J7]